MGHGNQFSVNTSTYGDLVQTASAFKSQGIKIVPEI
jgi:alpha-glucosidase (family GH31 glycosyl hydrolase)